VAKFHDRKGAAERRIGQFSSEFLRHLPLGNFMANWVYMLCAQLAYNLSYWLRDLVLPPFYRKKHIKRIRRCVGLVAAKVTNSGHQIRLKLSVLHPWWKDFVYALEKDSCFGNGCQEWLKNYRKDVPSDSRGEESLGQE